MKKNVSLIGTAALFFGCFLPFIHAPIVGSISLISRPDGTILLVIAGLGGLFALCNKVGVASVAGWLSLALLICDYVDASNRINNPASDNAFANAFIKATVSFGEAWPVLFLGALAVIVAAFLDRKTEPSKPTTGPQNLNRVESFIDKIANP